jgi:hypothetical protein
MASFWPAPYTHYCEKLTSGYVWSSLIHPTSKVCVIYDVVLYVALQTNTQLAIRHEFLYIYKVCVKYDRDIIRHTTTQYTTG